MKALGSLRTGWPVLLFGLGIAVLAHPAWGHRLITTDTEPVSPETAIVVRKPAVSQVYYSAVDPLRPETWFTFKGEAGDRLVLNLGVPHIERLKDFRPLVALIGPGLPEGDFPSSPGNTGRIFEPDAYPAVFHEPVTGTDSWMLVSRETVLPETGLYYVAVFPNGPLPEEPKLWLAIGYLERFTFWDILSFFRIRRYVRNFHELR